MNMLVGCTGFVGSNLDKQITFDHKYHSTNIRESYGLRPDILYYAGVRAEKYLANAYPKQDWMHIEQAISNIKKINPTKVVLISTIDVYPSPYDADERAPINPESNSPYGKHRYLLEQWVAEAYGSNATVVRLPALFGAGLKKNFLYDLIHIVPSLLKEGAVKELKETNPEIARHYHSEKDGFWALNELTNAEFILLRSLCLEADVTALMFSDSRSRYQYYNIEHLSSHIEIAVENGLSVVNLVTEPVSVSSIESACGLALVDNELASGPAIYDIRSIYGEYYGSTSHYIMQSQMVLDEMQHFYQLELNRLIGEQ